jgi:putative transposase
MPQLTAVPISLSESEKADLEKLLRRSSTSQQIALRAKIILRAAAGEGHGEIARALGIAKYTSRLWRNRWLELRDREMSVEEKLEDLARSGKPATFSIEQLTQLYALACDPPEKYGRPISHWTPRELADELIKQKIVESISPRHVGRLLCEADLKPYQSGYWLHPPPTQRSKQRSKISAKSTNWPQREPNEEK